MAEYINREDLIISLEETIKGIKGTPMWVTMCEAILRAVKDMSAADVQEVKHGRWIGKPIAGYANIRCSACGDVVIESTGKWKYCPNCGARMDAEG